MNINKREIKLIVSALGEAVLSTEALIDAHRIAWDKRQAHRLEKCIPPEYRGVTNQWKRRVKKWRELMKKLRIAQKKNPVSEIPEIDSSHPRFPPRRYR